MLGHIVNTNESANEKREITKRVYERYLPACDIEETKDAFVVSIDMPGVEPAEIKVELDRDMLSISGVSEISGLETRQYKREFRVMRGVDASKVKADYRLGILSLTLPKPEAQQARQIKIESE